MAKTNVLHFWKEKVKPMMNEKVSYSACLCCTFVLLGWSKAQLGTAFNDVMLITNSSLDKGSGFMTSYYIGFSIGCLIGGCVFKTINTQILLCTLLAGNGLSVLLIPWCTKYALMITTHFFYGFFSGAFDAVVIAEAVELWGIDFKVFIQILNFFFSVGGIIAPVATEPFLFPTTHLKNTSKISINRHFDMEKQQTLPGDTSIYNTTKPIKSRLYIALSITAAISFFVSLQFLAVFLRNYASKQHARRYEKLSDAYNGKNTEPERSLGGKIFILGTICFLGFIVNGIDFTFCGFLSVFVVQHFKWTSSGGSYITFGLFFAFLVGRFLGIFLIRKLKPVVLLCCSLALTAFGLIGFTASSYILSNIGLWFSSLVVGFGISNAYPLIVGWTNETFMTVTGNISSLILVTAYSGCLVNPLILGFLMHRYSTFWFCYLFIIETILGIVIYIILVITSLRYPK